MKRTESTLRVGQHVTAIALPMGYPEARPEITGLTVTAVTLVANRTIPPYYRVVAVGVRGETVIGAERFFVEVSHA